MVTLPLDDPLHGLLVQSYIHFAQFRVQSFDLAFEALVLRLQRLSCNLSVAIILGVLNKHLLLLLGLQLMHLQLLLIRLLPGLNFIVLSPGLHRQHSVEVFWPSGGTITVFLLLSLISIALQAYDMTLVWRGRLLGERLAPYRCSCCYVGRLEAIHSPCVWLRRLR